MIKIISIIKEFLVGLFRVIVGVNDFFSVVNLVNSLSVALHNEILISNTYISDGSLFLIILNVISVIMLIEYIVNSKSNKQKTKHKSVSQLCDEIRKSNEQLNDQIEKYRHKTGIIHNKPIKHNELHIYIYIVKPDNRR